jgi:hypothetical protein
MCEFFSFLTEPNSHPNQRFYFDWKYRKHHLKDDDSHDSHSTIARHFKLNEDACNKYEYNPLTKKFVIDQTNSDTDDSVQAEEWVANLDFKKVVKTLLIKPIVNPLLLPAKEITEDDVQLLKQWASVRASVGASVWASVGASVWDSVWAYISSFFDIKYDHDFSPCVKLWESGLVPSFDGTAWRLHSGENAKAVFEIEKDELKAK